MENQTAIAVNGKIYTHYTIENRTVHLPDGYRIPADSEDLVILYQSYEEEDGTNVLTVYEQWGQWAPAEEIPFEELWLDYFDHLHVRGEMCDVASELGFQAEEGQLYIGLEQELMAPASEEDFHDTVDLIKVMEEEREALPTIDTTVDLEVVTKPMEPKEMKDWIENNREFIQKIGIGKGVGAHVHISKAAFVSQLAQAYFTIVVHNALLSGRYEWLFGSLSNEDQEMAMPKKKSLNDYKNDYDRYEAVNHLNKHTIEVRAFRATNDPELLKARVDWLQRAIAWANRKASS